jgi:hypothetical protein
MGGSTCLVLVCSVEWHCANAPDHFRTYDELIQSREFTFFSDIAGRRGAHLESTQISGAEIMASKRAATD